MRHFVWLVFVVIIETVNALQCYKCMSREANGCQADRTTETCGAYDDACYSMLHVTDVKSSPNMTVRKYGKMRGCTDKRKGCEQLCFWYRENNHRCKVDCCWGNHCNTEPVVIGSQKKKRNFSNNSHSILKLTVPNICLVALSYILCIKLSLV